MSTKKVQCEREEMQRVMHDFKNNRLKSFTGLKVKDRRQAIAIGLSSKTRNCTRSGLKASVKRRRTRRVKK